MAAYSEVVGASKEGFQWRMLSREAFKARQARWDIQEAGRGPICK